MRGVYKIKGFYQDFKEGTFFEPRDFQVNITIDKIGATLSIVDLKSEKQYTIPVDWLIKEIKRGCEDNEEDL